MGCVVGCIEELGSCPDSHLKRKQGIRGTPEEHDTAAKDAIGDVIVYLLGVANAHIDPKQMILRVDKVGLELTRSTSCGSPTPSASW